MFKNLFGKPNKPNKNPTIAIYEDYKAEIEDMLTSWGFVIKRDEHSIGGNTTYRRGELEVMLGYDMRDPGVYLYARSGKMTSGKTQLDELLESIGKKIENSDEFVNRLRVKNDISVALGGSDEEKDKIIQDIKNWYHETSTSGLELSETTVEETTAIDHSFNEMLGRHGETQTRSDEPSKICPNCGFRNKANAIWCLNCKETLRPAARVMLILLTLLFVLLCLSFCVAIYFEGFR